MSMRILAVAALSAVALAGCSGGGSSTNTTTTTTTTTDNSTAAASNSSMAPSNVGRSDSGKPVSGPSVTNSAAP